MNAPWDEPDRYEKSGSSVLVGLGLTALGLGLATLLVGAFWYVRHHDAAPRPDAVTGPLPAAEQAAAARLVVMRFVITGLALLGAGGTLLTILRLRRGGRGKAARPADVTA